MTVVKNKEDVIEEIYQLLNSDVLDVLYELDMKSLPSDKASKVFKRRLSEVIYERFIEDAKETVE